MLVKILINALILSLPKALEAAKSLILRLSEDV
jgi:hypothetical protein